jgi:hydrophobe/amphiphile efflux-3 (HAE3) family protein
VRRPEEGEDPPHHPYAKRKRIDIVRKVARAVGSFIERRWLLLLLAAAVLTGVALVGATRVEIKTSQDTLISSNSKVYKDYTRNESYFGGDSIYILLTGELDALLSPANLTTAADLQDRLAADWRIKSVISPVTFLEYATSAHNSEDTRSMLEDPAFVRSVVFAPDGEIDPQLAQVIPDDQHTVMAVRLAGGLSADDQKAATKDINEMMRQYEFSNADVLVAGTPMLLWDVTDRMQETMILTVSLAVAFMVAVLFLVFPARWRILSLPLVLLGVLWIFGTTGFIGMPVSLVTMAGLPILIGLGTDFAIQFHNRYEEEVRRGDTPAAAVIDAITHIGPAVGIAVLATALGFVTLLISRVPAVRDFGIMLTFGVVILYAVGLFLLNSILYQRDRRRSFHSGSRTPRRPPPVFERLLGATARGAMRYPLPLIAVAVLLAGAGLYADRHLPVQTDVEKLIPSSTSALVNLNKAREVVTITKLPFLVEGEDLTRPEVLQWMASFQKEELSSHPDELLSVESPSTVVASAGDEQIPSSDVVDETLASLPQPVRDGLITPDGRAATVAFGVELMPVEDLDDLIDQIQDDLKYELKPPTGITAVPAGTMTLSARSTMALTANRELITLVGVLAVTLGLLAVYRNPLRALMPVLPIGLVVGWSAGFMYLAGIDLNPLTAVMGALIIGIGTEFTVLLLERYYEEKAKGAPPKEAMLTAVGRVGRAIGASGLTVTAGFATLIFSDFPALRDFGWVTVVTVLFALTSALLVLPPIVVWLDERIQSRNPV